MVDQYRKDCVGIEYLGIEYLVMAAYRYQNETTACRDKK